mgnify:CR=1 FL=1
MIHTNLRILVKKLIRNMRKINLMIMNYNKYRDSQTNYPYYLLNKKLNLIVKYRCMSIFYG